MTEPLTLERLVTLIETQADIGDQEITEKTQFVDLGFDPLDRVEMQLVLEDELGEDLTVAEKELDEVRTVGDLMRVVNAALDDAS
ncbi:MAG: acyl carrier protein [Geminicoccaceae bacterium]